MKIKNLYFVDDIYFGQIRKITEVEIVASKKSLRKKKSNSSFIKSTIFNRIDENFVEDIQNGNKYKLASASGEIYGNIGDEFASEHCRHYLDKRLSEHKKKIITRKKLKEYFEWYIQ